jgi:hypothetical protein
MVNLYVLGVPSGPVWLEPFFLMPSNSRPYLPLFHPLLC